MTRNSVPDTGAAAPQIGPSGVGVPAAVRATHWEMLRRTEVALRFGEIVVLDASWAADRWRTESRSVATATASELVELRCSAPPGTAVRRMRRRRNAGGDPSDATPEIAAELALGEDPWPTAAVVDTCSGPGEALVKALALIGQPGH